MLIAGGEFGNAGGVGVNRIASWNGSTWSALGSGVDDYVFAVTPYQGGLIVGGQFSHAGGQPAANIARWNGSTWSALGAGLTGYPFPSAYAMTVWNGLLVVAGEFDQAGGVAATNIATWNGATWAPMGSGLGGSTLSGYAWVFVYGLGVYNGDLIATGDYTMADGTVSVNGIARWNGSAWSAFGSGLDNYGLSMATFGTDLYVGGYFTGAGERPSASIARWSDAPAGAPNGNSVVDAFAPEVAPNPFLASATVRYSLSQPGDVRLAIYDVNGARVTTLVETHQSAGVQTADWNGEDANGRRVAPGVYYADLRTPAGRSRIRLVALR
jgi:hypothetical protein